MQHKIQCEIHNVFVTYLDLCPVCASIVASRLKPEITNMNINLYRHTAHKLMTIFILL